MSSKVKLEIDPSIIENKLKIKDFESEGNGWDSLFKKPPESGVENGVPWKTIYPHPALCVKFFTSEGDKSFVNVCTSAEIPSPEIISDAKLIAIIESDNPSSYRVPMSILDPHTEKDKSGNLTLAYDVAVNPSVVSRIQTNDLFKVFMMTAILESIQEKYKINVDLSRSDPFIILKNRKTLGTLRPHRIRQSDTKPPPLIEVVSTPKSSNSLNDTTLDPKLKLEKHPAHGEPEYLIARVRIKAVSEKDILLDVGEDRLILTGAKKRLAFVDIFLPYNVDAETTTAEYSRCLQELKIYMPVKK